MNKQNINRAKKQLDDGFTLIELLIVMAIVSILSFMATMKLYNRTDEAELVAVQQDIKVLADASANHRVEHRKWPAVDANLPDIDKLIRALGGGLDRNDFKKIVEEDIEEHVQSTRHTIDDYVLVTGGKYEGHVFYIGSEPVFGEDGNDYHGGGANGEDITSKPPIKYDHSELYAYISEVKTRRINEGDGEENELNFTDEEMYEFKNAESQIGDGNHSEDLQRQFNDEKRYMHVDKNSSELLAGDSNSGYYGLVHARDLFTGDELAELIGLTEGTPVNSDAPWLKFSNNGKVIYKSQKTYRSRISWDAIDRQGAVFGSIKVKDTKDETEYKVRLMRGAENNPVIDGKTKNSEWERLLYPIHDRTASDGYDFGIGFSAVDLTGRGNNEQVQWTQESSPNHKDLRMARGSNDVYDHRKGITRIDYRGKSTSYTNSGGGSWNWSPVLEKVD